MAILRKQGQAASHALLGCYSNFTFLKGASHPDEMVAQGGRAWVGGGWHCRCEFAGRYCAGACGGA